MLKIISAQSCIALFLVGHFSALGQQISDATLAEVQVVASKFPEKLARTGKVVSVITRQQIQASLGKGLGELLQETVGISVVGSRSAPGTNQEVYIRGANTGQVLLLIDGFPANDPSHISSVMDWNLVNLAN
jgi:vitamin B12 transporter